MAITRFIVPQVKNPELIPSPANYNIIVKPLEIEEKTKSGIILAAETIKDEQYITAAGVVVKMGPTCFEGGAFMGAKACEIGDVVFYGRHNGHPFKVGEDSFILIADDRVMMTYKKDELDKLDNFGPAKTQV